MVQWLRLHATTTGDTGLIPGRGRSCMPPSSAKKEKKIGKRYQSGFSLFRESVVDTQHHTAATVRAGNITPPGGFPALPGAQFLLPEAHSHSRPLAHPTCASYTPTLAGPVYITHLAFFCQPQALCPFWPPPALSGLHLRPWLFS